MTAGRAQHTARFVLLGKLEKQLVLLFQFKELNFSSADNINNQEYSVAKLWNLIQPYGSAGGAFFECFKSYP